MNKQMSIYDAIAAITIEMQNAGIGTDYEPRATGNIERFKIRGKSGRCGWVVVHGNGKYYHAAFGDWSVGSTFTWSSFDESKLDIDQHRQFLKERAEIEKKRRDSERQFQEEKRKEASTIFSNLKDAKHHPYAEKKQIGLTGLKYAQSLQLTTLDGKDYELKDCLVIPYTNVRGQFMTMQIITSSGSKIFYGGAPKRGSMVMMGDDSLDRIILGEGYSTVRTVYDTTQSFCVAAGDAGNLLPVAEELRAQYPTKQIIIIADNDQYKDKNTGVESANNIKEKVKNVRVVVPEFSNTEHKPTDFNDLLVLFGKAELDKQILNGDLVSADEVYTGEIDDSIFITPLPHMSIGSNPKPKATIENFAVMMQRLNIKIAYNAIKKNLNIDIPNEKFDVDNRVNSSIARIISRCAQFDFPVSHLNDFIGHMATSNSYNPVIDWIDSCQWDGVDRLSQLLSTITPKDPIQVGEGEFLHEAFIKRWMIQAVASAYNPKGFSGGGVLVLQGDQNLGKTTWLRRLVGDQTDLFKDGMVLRLDKKDDVKQAISYWLVELGELDSTFNKSEASALKAFLTNCEDEIRLPYAKSSSNFPRRTSFCASVNPEQFLKDPTGNRRYWTIACCDIDNTLELDMQQVWAQVYDLWRSGYKPYLNQDEFDSMMKSNEDFAEIDPIMEMVQTKLNWSAPINEWRWSTATDILLNMEILKPTRLDLRMVNQAVRKLNDDKFKRSGGKNLVYIPPMLNALDKRFK